MHKFCVSYLSWYDVFELHPFAFISCSAALCVLFFICVVSMHTPVVGELPQAHTSTAPPLHTQDFNFGQIQHSYTSAAPLVHTQDVRELQQAYTSTSPPMKEPCLYLLAHFQAPTKLYSMVNLPACSSPDGSINSSSSESRGCGVEQQGQSMHNRQEDQGVHGSQGQRQHHQQRQQGLLLASVDGRVRIYDWDDPGVCVCICVCTSKRTC